MDEKTMQLMDQLKQDPAALQALMHSRDGQALIQMLTRADHGAGLQRAVQSAARGNTADMVGMVQTLMQSAEGASLVQRIQQTLKQQ